MTWGVFYARFIGVVLFLLWDFYKNGVSKHKLINDFIGFFKWQIMNSAVIFDAYKI